MMGRSLCAFVVGKFKGQIGVRRRSTRFVLVSSESE